jgi:hypothetical protein
MLYIRFHFFLQTQISLKLNVQNRLETGSFAEPVCFLNRFSEPVHFSNRFSKPVRFLNRFSKPVRILNRFNEPVCFFKPVQ